MAGRVHARARLDTPVGVSVREQLAEDPGLLASRWGRGGRTVAVMHLKRQAAKAKLPRPQINALAKAAGQSLDMDRAQTAVGGAFSLWPGKKSSSSSSSSSGSSSGSSSSGKRGRGRPPTKPKKAATPKAAAPPKAAKPKKEAAPKAKAPKATAPPKAATPAPAPKADEQEMQRLRARRLTPDQVASLNLTPPKAAPKKGGVGGTHLF